MRTRLVLAAALAVPAVALGGAAQADPLPDLDHEQLVSDPVGWCWDHTGFRVGALVCSKLP
jgi:type IV secretory pathway protease TraF